MPRKRFLPSFNTAPGPHRAMVRDPAADAEIRFGTRRPDPVERRRAIADLRRKRHLAQVFGAVSLGPGQPPEAPNQSLEGWRSLKEGVHTWLGDHLASVPIPKYGSFATDKAAREHVIKAAREGASTDVAFLEVVGKTLYAHDFADPNKEIADWARRSVGFIIEWAGLSESVDYELAWSLARPKPRKLIQVFQDLHFESRWFTADDQMGRVGLNPEKVANLRSEDNTPPQRFDDPRRALFACPAAVMIPRMHHMLVDQAEAAGLFGLTYLEERANHGYSDAWQAMAALSLRSEQADAPNQ